MPNEELLRELLGVFSEEAEERLETADALLLEIERSDEARPEAFAKLLREMHTLKGSAAAVSLDDVSTVSHDLETFFTRIRDGEIPCEPASLDVGYHALREMRTMIRTAVTGGESGVDVAVLRERLSATAFGEGAAASDVPSTPAAAPASVLIAPQSVASGQPSEVSDRPVPEETPSAADDDAAAAAANAGARETVRVATSKLDGLMAQVGELLITTMDREERRTELREVLDSLTTWADGWKKVRSERDRIDAYVAEARNTTAGQTVDELDRLSWMGHMVEFMREGETRLEDVHARLGELDRTLRATDRRTRQATADLQDEVLSVRMLPVSAVFDSLPRLVRELGRALGKEATLEIAAARRRWTAPSSSRCAGP